MTLNDVKGTSGLVLQRQKWQNWLFRTHRLFLSHECHNGWMQWTNDMWHFRRMQISQSNASWQLTMGEGPTQLGFFLVFVQSLFLNMTMCWFHTITHSLSFFPRLAFYLVSISRRNGDYGNMVCSLSNERLLLMSRDYIVRDRMQSVTWGNCYCEGCYE